MQQEQSYTAFCCPWCGLHACYNLILDYYRCAGRDCKFTVHKNDFWKYQRRVTISKFDSQEEYENTRK